MYPRRVFANVTDRHRIDRLRGQPDVQGHGGAPGLDGGRGADSTAQTHHLERSQHFLHGPPRDIRAAPQDEHSLDTGGAERVQRDLLGPGPDATLGLLGPHAVGRDLEQHFRGVDLAAMPCSITRELLGLRERGEGAVAHRDLQRVFGRFISPTVARVDRNVRIPAG